MSADSPPLQPDLLMQVADHVGDLIWSSSAPSFNLEYVNPVVAAVYGREPQAFYEDPGLWLAAIHPEDRPAVARSHYELLRRDRVERRYRVVRPDGSVCWLHDRAWAMRDQAGRLLRICGIARDIGEQVKAEERQREELEMHRSVFQNTHDAAFLVQVDGPDAFRYVETNPAHQQKTGLGQAATAGRTPQEVLGPEQGAAVAARYQRCVDAGVPVEYEERLALPAGVRDWLTQLVPIRGEDRRVHLLAGIGRDITPIRAADRLIQEAHGELDRLLSAGPAVVYASRPEPGLAANYLSPSFPGITGYSRADALGDSQWRDRTLHPEDRARVAGAIDQLLAQGGSQKCRYRLRHAAGHYFWVQDEMRLLRNAAGEPEEVIGALVDVSESEELFRSQQKLAEHLPGLVYQYRVGPDGRGRFPYASPKSWDMFGVDPERLRESDAAAFAVVHPDDRGLVVGSIRRSAETLGPWACEYRVRHPKGHELWVSGHATPERLDDGSVLWHGFIADITAHKLTQLALAQSEARYRRITENISDLACLHEPDGRYRFVSPSVQVILGYTPEEMLGRDPYELMHPDERQRVRDGSHAKVLAGEAEAGIEHRFRHRDGHYIWLETKTTPLLDAAGEVVALQTLSRDVTARRQAQDAMKAVALRLERILEAAGEGIYGVDAEGRITFLNRAAANMLGWTLAEVQGQGSHQLFHAHHRDGSPYPEAACPAQRALRDGCERRAADEWFWRRDGSGFPVELVCSPLHENGAVAGAVVVFQDITERKQAQELLEQLATIDALTGAPNRRYFLERLGQELQRLERHGASASLLMFDADHFKRVNDRWGHAAGDEVLRQLARGCQQQLRASDVMGRLGGEEFAVLLPQTDSVGGMQFAERLRLHMANLRTECSGEAIAVTISLGVTELRPGDTPETALERADRALYAAKAGGRDRAVLAGEAG